MANLDDWAKKIEKAFSALDSADYYTILSVPKDADTETIRKAFYSRAKKLHPDRARNLPEPTRSQSIAIYKRVAEAYNILTNPETRKLYDEMLKEGNKRLIISDRLSLKPKSEYDFLSTEAGKQFYIAAKQAFEAGNVSQAKLNIKLAISYEGEKPQLLELLDKIQKKP